ncbi:hypothetical protein JXB11_00460 [Candidatus Woesearchaeota archaeon]|nr:hypothetical protein [Candidatus Woesearchaeota archaeon]
MEKKWLLLGALCVLVALACVKVLNEGNFEEGAVESREISAMVDGVVVYADNVEAEQQRALDAGVELSFEEALNVVIQKVVLLQAAEKEGLSVAELIENHTSSPYVMKADDVEALYNETYAGTNVSFEEVESVLVGQLMEERKEAAAAAYIQSLLDSAQITVFSG